MLSQPATKYRAFPAINLPDRQWPNNTITRPPIWMSTDLRDGNQALFEPMNAERKMQMFNLLCSIGVKEIEVAFPSASQTDFDFVRSLIEQNHIPADVTIEVLTQAREHLIRRTFESLYGAKRAIVHIYNATAKPWREVVFGMSKDEVVTMAVDAIQLAKELAAAHPETEWILEYSPETFSATELDFAKQVCDAVTETWGASPTRPVILNLPSTVEMSTPNVYADQVEWMHRNLARREGVILSVHPHNDRGTAVAAAELAVMAGADRVEGCLFGNGERTGNVDLVTLALNLYTQGVAPGLDFSDINAVARTVEHCNQLPIHPRHPYVGDLVFTAFSGSHQDAIKKGFAARDAAAEGEKGIWEVPYLPIDPSDLGRTYDSIIRVNSQSGKGGVAYLLESAYGLVMPRRLQVEFSQVVQAHTDATGSEVNAHELWALFSQTYLNDNANRWTYLEHHLFEIEEGQRQGIELTVADNGVAITLHGEGVGPIDAAMAALAPHVTANTGHAIHVHSYEERSLSHGENAEAVAFVELASPGKAGTRYGVGMHSNIVTASVQAIMSGINRITSE
jgi:2-isopropylmalate synthase